MASNIILSFYFGSLFLLVFVVAPLLLRVKENKDLAGRFYGRILWRFYALAFPSLVVYLILSDVKTYGVLLIMGLLTNVGISHWLKTYKREIGNIDLLEPHDKKRVRFRRVSKLSTLVLFLNLLLSLYILIKIQGG